MLHPDAPYPYVGSYALLEHEGENQLVRILFRREGEVVVGLPLKEGASGNLRVDPTRLIDATPLTGKEMRDFHNLDRDLAGIEARIRRWAENDEPGRCPRMTPRQKAMAERRDALKRRVVFGPILDRLLRVARAYAEQRAA